MISLFRDTYNVPEELSLIILSYKAHIEQRNWEIKMMAFGCNITRAIKNKKRLSKYYRGNVIYDGAKLFTDYYHFLDNRPFLNLMKMRVDFYGETLDQSTEYFTKYPFLVDYMEKQNLEHAIYMTTIIRSRR